MAKKQPEPWEIFPRSTPAQKSYDGCKVGDTIWLTGGFHMAGISDRDNSFGYRTRVTGIKTGTGGGIISTDEKGNSFSSTSVITLRSIRNFIVSCSEEEKTRWLSNFDENDIKIFLTEEEQKTDPATRNDKSSVFDELMRKLSEQEQKTETERQLLSSYIEWKSPSWGRKKGAKK